MKREGSYTTFPFIPQIILLDFKHGCTFKYKINCLVLVIFVHVLSFWDSTTAEMNL